jgi:protein-S-isoprenylcysteine O-methyltransferase Ste14
MNLLILNLVTDAIIGLGGLVVCTILIKILFRTALEAKDLYHQLGKKYR